MLTVSRGFGGIFWDRTGKIALRQRAICDDSGQNRTARNRAC
jgi:hypothetical protein